MDTITKLLTGANVFSWLAGVSTVLIPVLVIRYLDRKKHWIEQREAAARTELALVSTKSVELRDDLATGEGVGKMLTTLIEAGETVHDLQQQVFELKGRTLRAEADAQVAQLFVQQMNAAAKLAGVHLSDYTPGQLKQAMRESE